MKMLTALVLSAPIVGTTLIAATTAPLLAQMTSAVDPSHARDSEEIRTTWRRFIEAWNKHDPQAMGEAWTDAGTLITPFGRRAEGRARIIQVFTDEQRGPMARSFAALESPPQVSFLKPDVAFVETDLVINGRTGPDGRTLPPLQVHVPAIATRTMDGSWRLLHARPTVFQPPPAAAPQGRTPPAP